MNAVIDRLNTALEGRYRIERELGEGGMAVVYLADDLKHARRVAIKVLKAELAQMLGKERFLAEIRTTANLQHPNILPLFDSGEADGFLFYVMPFVEGETLRDRLSREVQLPVDQALDLIRKVASALEYAHGKGIVHRDLKPANILLSSGEPLVADFGIALAVQHAGEGRMTQTGLSMGTPQYMSPEQASGDRSLDPRSDIYALGCVLFEMLSGDPPFSGSNAQAVLARILTTVPTRVTVQRPTVPPHVDAAVARSLEKIPADRFTTASDFRKALDDPSFRHTTAAHIEAGEHPKVVVRRRDPALLFGLASVAVLAVVAAVVGWTRSAAPTTSEIAQRYLVEVSSYNGNGPDMAISPDGSQIVYVGDDGQLYLRPVGSLESQLLPGTEGARGPTFSPTGASIAFNAGTPDRFFTLTLSGGSAVPVGSPNDPVNVQASWGEDGYIYYERDAGERAIVRARAQGGPPEVLARSTPEMILQRPSAIPGRSDAILVTVAGRGLHLLEVETGDLEPVAGLERAASGHVAGDLIVWHSRDDVLQAAPFDAAAGRLVGPSVTLARDVMDQDFAVSASGALLYRSTALGAVGETETTIGFVDADGQLTVPDSSTAVSGASLGSASVSPDGRFLALTVLPTGGSDVQSQIVIYDVRQQTSYRLTFEGANYAPSWMADGRVAYLHSVGTQLAAEIRAQPFDRSAPEEVLMVYESGIEDFDAHPDPATPLVVNLESGPELLAGLYVFRPGGDPTRPDLTPFVATAAEEAAPAISPDGRWLAYSTSEAGDLEVQVRSFPEPGRPYPVSDGPATAPAWDPDMRWIVYATQGGLARRQLELDQGVRIGAETTADDGQILAVLSGLRAYDVTAGGELVGVVRSGRREAGRALAVILLNLHAEVEARLSEVSQ